MPEIQIRPVTPADLPVLVALDHSYITDYVWQMDLQARPGQVGVTFREIRLPRSVRQEYPRDAIGLADQWDKLDAMLVAESEGVAVGYISLLDTPVGRSTAIPDLAVERRVRRQGIGTALLLAAQEWASQQERVQLIIEMQSKNYPAIALVQRLGFDFCGYNDRYYPNQDIALFFGKALHR